MDFGEGQRVVVGRALQISSWILQLLSKKEQREEKGGEEQGKIPGPGGRGRDVDGLSWGCLQTTASPWGVQKEKFRLCLVPPRHLHALA